MNATMPDSTGPRRRILLVDDSISALAAISTVLEDQGFEVTTAPGGRKGLEAFAAAPFDLVILDIFMPEMDGLQVCQGIRAKETEGKVPILFLTGDGNPSTQAESIRAGGDDLILKSALHSELVIRVQSLLRQRHLQEAIRTERDALKESKRNKELLTRFIVHDLKNPLQSMKLLVESMREGQEDPERREKRLGNLQEVIETMTRMIQDLLDAESSQEGRLVIHSVPFLLGPQLTSWVEEGLRAALNRKRQEIRVEIPESLILSADFELLRRCLLNLIENASKYGPRDSVIEVRAQATDDGIHLQVVDSGPGVPEIFKDRIFDVYFRLDGDVAKARVSNGLGLAFCRQVVEAHGGKIWVSDAVPRGSTFNLQIPCLGPGA
jgi:signal transduction histidine kinase